MIDRSLFSHRAHDLIPQIEIALTKAIDQQTCPDSLREAIVYSLLGGGKRIRSLLALLTAELCGGSIHAAMPAAIAIEMIHCYSLIHDDLPAMDNDDLRRGKPTNHKVYGEGQAILAGDGLLTLAFEVLTEIDDPRVSRDCIRTLSKAAGVAGMVGGQSDDLFAQGKEGSLALLESIHVRKTGALIGAAIEMGAIIAGASQNQKNALRLYGEAIGLLFQMTDDLLDVNGSTEIVGKKVRKDAIIGKMTFPGLLGIDETKKRADFEVQKAIDALKIFDEKADILRSLVVVIKQRNS
ncbi:MAG: polyprenyl synthetase family protein [Candidatus Peribacteraceae bacterium]|nr:polyprenyl synthetase family protein [Candidatus Peribacteraceae bacterium]